MTIESPREFFRTTIAGAAGADCAACRVGTNPCPGCAAEALLNACRREDLIVLTRDAGESMVDTLAEQIFTAIKDAARDLQDIGMSVLGATLGVATGRPGEGIYRLSLTEASRTAARVALGIKPEAAVQGPRIPGGAAGLLVLSAIADRRVVQTRTDTRLYSHDGSYGVANAQMGELAPSGLVWCGDPVRPGSVLIVPRHAAVAPPGASHDRPEQVWYVSDGPLPATHEAVVEGRVCPLPRGEVRMWNLTDLGRVALRTALRNPAGAEG